MSHILGSLVAFAVGGFVFGAALGLAGVRFPSWKFWLLMLLFAFYGAICNCVGRFEGR